MSNYTIGQRVLRREGRPSREATILAVEIASDCVSYAIAYAEGGEGWWPHDALEPDHNDG